MSIPQRAGHFQALHPARDTRREAYLAALEARAIVRDWRRRIASSSSWFVVQTDWEEELEAERENWRETIWGMNRL